MKTIERFYEEDPIDLYLFFNGKYDFWHEMPKMNRSEKNKTYVIKINFKNFDEILEFYDLIGFKEKWGGDKPILPNNAKLFRVLFPNNLKDKKRNYNYRFVHEKTALANPEIYEIVPIENLHYD